MKGLTFTTLLDHGADISFANCQLRIPQQSAARSGSRSLAKLLLDRGADFSRAGGALSIPLQAAAWAGGRSCKDTPGSRRRRSVGFEVLCSAAIANRQYEVADGI